MSIGWMVNVPEADTHFTKRFDAAAWTACITAQKTAALWQAFYRIVDCKDYNVSQTTPPSAPLKRAQCEMAYYLIKHISAEDHRLGLQVQNVTQAGIVQEVYDGKDLPIPAIVDNILDKAGMKKYQSAVGITSIGRDETLDIDEKVDEYSEI